MTGTYFRRDTVCPTCGIKHSPALGVISGTGGDPQESDIALCDGCGNFAIFTTIVSGGLRRPSPREAEAIRSNRDAMKAREAWVYANASRPS